MIFGILSDTHDRKPGISKAVSIFNDAGAELIVHCGDWTKPDTASYLKQLSLDAGIPLRGVLGNNDREVAELMALNENNFELQEGVLRFEASGKAVTVYHGHHQPTLRTLFTDNSDLLCLGHSHKPRYDRLDSKVVVNPGSTAFSIPRRRGWQASVALYDSDTHEARFMYYEP